MTTKKKLIVYKKNTELELKKQAADLDLSLQKHISNILDKQAKLK